MIRIKIEGKVPTVFFKEDDMIIAYSAALNITTCGKNIQEAKKNFKECLRIYFSEIIKHGTLEKDLIKHGWKINPKKLTIEPPVEKKSILPYQIIKTNNISIPVTV